MHRKLLLEHVSKLITNTTYVKLLSSYYLCSISGVYLRENESLDSRMNLEMDKTDLKHTEAPRNLATKR